MTCAKSAKSALLQLSKTSPSKSFNQLRKLNSSATIGNPVIPKIVSEKLNFTPSLFSKATRSRISSATVSAPHLKEEETVTICRPCQPHDREDMIDFMRQQFVTREPLMKSLGATYENSAKYVSYCVDEALEQDVSFVAIEEESGQICGLRMNTIGPSSGRELNVDFGPKINAIPRFLHHIEEGTEQSLETREYIRHVAICVKPSATQSGIATDLMDLSVRHAIGRNLSHMTAMCSWKVPYMLARKMGYSSIRELEYRDYAQLEKGDVQKAFLTLAKAEEKARIMVKKLS